LDKLQNEDLFNKLKDLYEKSESVVKTDAVVYRAYVDKISSNTIADKVSAQMNSIKVSMDEINPKFREGSKNYKEIKESITTLLADYENSLRELSDFYDTKIEQLILRRVELEASFIGAILNEEYLSEKLYVRQDQQKNDKVKQKLLDNFSNMLEKLNGGKKKTEEINTREISRLIDGNDLKTELEYKLAKKIERTMDDQKANFELLEKSEKELALIDAEIERLNEQKKNAIMDAMEVGDKTITRNIRRPKVFKTITRFFISKFNTARIIESQVINPLRIRIENFKKNELSSMKG